MTNPNVSVEAISKAVLKALKNEKHEIIENKFHFKWEKNEVKEYKDNHKPEFEQVDWGFRIPGPDPVSKEQLLAQAEALEAAGKQLRHFIAQSERPDLADGALRNEPDQG